MIAIYALISTAAVALWWWRYGMGLGPDGLHYGLAMAGQRVMAPFRHRGLLLRWPWLSRGVPELAEIDKQSVEPFLAAEAPSVVRVLRWQSWVSLVACGTLVGALADWHGAPGWLAVVLFVSLPWFRHCARFVGYLDPMAMTLALGSAVAWLHGFWWLAVPLSAASGLTHERGPVFAALFAWSPWLLLGLVAHGLARLWFRGSSDACPYRGAMDVSFSAHRQTQAERPMLEWVLPFGVVLVGIGGSGIWGLEWGATWHVATLLALSVGQLVVAMGCARLVQWAAPVLCVTAAGVVAQWPAEWIGVAIALHVASPWGEARW